MPRKSVCFRRRFLDNTSWCPRSLCTACRRDSACTEWRARTSRTPLRRTPHWVRTRLRMLRSREHGSSSRRMRSSRQRRTESCLRCMAPCHTCCCRTCHREYRRPRCSCRSGSDRKSGLRNRCRTWSTQANNCTPSGDRKRCVCSLECSCRNGWGRWRDRSSLRRTPSDRTRIRSACTPRRQKCRRLRRGSSRWPRL